MIGSLLAVLIMSAQPAPAEEPAVEVQAEVQTEVQADAPAEAPAAQVQAAAEVEAAPAEPEEEVVCRRRLVPSERIGQRNRVIRDCRPASEWATTRRRR
jgi:hypothetical protein